MTRTTIHSDYIPDNAITGVKIAENSITAREIATNAITTLYVADDSVTADKLANSINVDIATGVAALPKAGGTLTGDLTIPSKIIHSGDTDTYLRFTDNDDFRIVVGNSTRAAFNTSKIHFNQEGINQDFQVEGEGTGNEGLLYVDASTNKVGIGHE